MLFSGVGLRIYSRYDNMNNHPKKASGDFGAPLLLQRESDEPLYTQLENAIREKVVSGAWPQGFRLPTYRKLAEITGVSLITVQQAIDNLVGNNILYRRQGQGTFVASREMKPASNRVGLFLPNLREPFFSVMAQIIQTEMINDGYAVSIFALDDGVAQIARAVEIMLEQHVDGIITTTAANTETFSQVVQLAERDIPVVLVDGHLPEGQLSYVETDNYNGMQLIMDHLTGLGHRCIGFASGPCYTFGLKARMEAFSQIMGSSPLGFNPSYLQISHLDQDAGGYDAAHKLLSLREPPTAIACSTDIIAAGVLHAARSLKIRVPEQLSVVGFDDLYLAAHLEVALTTVKQPVEKIARLAKRMLLERMNKAETKFESHVLPPKLILRASTAPAPQTVTH
jgi:DNA-binding LacI/PurR family transcriptional regulator